jgi:hypothetical protein
MENVHSSSATKERWILMISRVMLSVRRAFYQSVAERFTLGHYYHHHDAHRISCSITVDVSMALPNAFCASCVIFKTCMNHVMPNWSHATTRVAHVNLRSQDTPSSSCHPPDSRRLCYEPPSFESIWKLLKLSSSCAPAYQTAALFPARPEFASLATHLAFSAIPVFPPSHSFHISSSVSSPLHSFYVFFLAGSSCFLCISLYSFSVCSPTPLPSFSRAPCCLSSPCVSSCMSLQTMLAKSYCLSSRALWSGQRLSAISTYRRELPRQCGLDSIFRSLLFSVRYPRAASAFITSFKLSSPMANDFLANAAFFISLPSKRSQSTLQQV